MGHAEAGLVLANELREVNEIVLEKDDEEEHDEKKVEGKEETEEEIQAGAGTVQMRLSQAAEALLDIPEGIKDAFGGKSEGSELQEDANEKTQPAVDAATLEGVQVVGSAATTGSLVFAVTATPETGIVPDQQGESTFVIEGLQEDDFEDFGLIAA
jgi:hypothetical protein